MSDRRVRIQKALADAGIASRRKAEEMVAAGRIAVDGIPATIGQIVDPWSDRITVDGHPVSDRADERVYIAMAKPAGVTSTVSDRHATRTVIDLVPTALRRTAARLYPIGRLDRDSEGLLLLTNDGGWAQRMLHPSHGVEREYAVGIDHRLNRAQVDALEQGIDFQDGRASLVRLVPATSADERMLAGLLGRAARDLAWYRVTLRQGMKRQLRRMFGAVGAPVRRLVRVRFGTVRLTGMALGDVRALTAQERRQLDSMVTDGRPTQPGRPATGKPATRKPQTGQPATDNPVTDKPATDKPATDNPVTDKPATDKPASDRQTSRAPRRAGLVVSVDGPGGSGKSSVGAGAAAKLGYRFCDTGVLYRGLTWLALQRGVDLDDAGALEPLVEQLELGPDEAQRYVRLVVDGRDVTDDLHTAEVDREVSRVSRHSGVRARLLPVQHALAAAGRIVMAGRDIGTVVLPDADLKIYLDVSIEERARRRARERDLENDPAALAQIEDELRRRDGVDSSRTTAPLRIPEGATVINTEDNTLEQTVDAVVAAVRGRERELDGQRR